jgi:beta-glucosidase
LPQLLQDTGGWTNRATADAFAEYTEVVTRRLGDRVKHWITLNEPWCSSFLSYWIGEHAPGHKDFNEALAAVHSLLLAHGKAVPIIRRNSDGAKVGITLNLSHAYPASDSPADQAATQRYDGYFNRWFLDPLYGRGYPQDMLELYGDRVPVIEPTDFNIIAAPTDFLGLNYYNPTFIHDNPDGGILRTGSTRWPGDYTAMDWLVYPQGLYDQLLRVPCDYPIEALYITENGAAYADEMSADGRVHDRERSRYYQQHLAAAQRAITDGSPLKGYFAWSLMDNFEWAFGYTRRFGIIYVDYETQQRTIKDSGYLYRDTVAANGVVGS